MINPRNRQIGTLKAKTYASIIIVVLATLNILFVTWTVQASRLPQDHLTYKVTKPEVKVLTQEQQIRAYINQVFGAQANNAFKVLSCENHRLNPSARGMNTNGTSDVGIFQINSVHGIPEYYLKDWRTNIDIAYQIYKASGWNAWACVTEYHALK